MQCSHPLLAHSSFNIVTGKWSKPDIIRNWSESERKSTERIFEDHPLERVFYIPCGQCMECRLNYAREWTVRTVLESTLYRHNLFITFTYDDFHLPSVPVESPTGLHPLDYQDMISCVKRLREHFKRKFCIEFRYVFCGEYGDRYSRPHFHMIMLNSPSLSDLDAKLYKSKPFPLYTSKLIESIWGKGFAPLSISNSDCIGYVCRYILKKYKGKAADVEAYYKSLGLVPEKRYQSRMPGIGAPWLEKNMHNVYSNGCVVVPTVRGSYACRPPAYFDSLFLRSGGDPLVLLERTIRNDESRVFRRDEELAGTSLDEVTYMSQKHDKFIDEMAFLYNRDLQSHYK